MVLSHLHIPCSTCYAQAVNSYWPSSVQLHLVAYSCHQCCVLRQCLPSRYVIDGPPGLKCIINYAEVNNGLMKMRTAPRGSRLGKTVEMAVAAAFAPAAADELMSSLGFCR